MTRRIAYVSGSRADFGLMESTLQSIRACDDLSLGIIVTGMHLAPDHGNTVREIEAAGLPIEARIPVNLLPATGRTMACGIGRMLCGLTEHLAEHRPDLVLLLGDRGEMLAGALAAVHLNIVVAHVHGGERSGTVDEPVRHAISKLSHYHFVATAEARERLIRMGELPERVTVTGAPGLDGLTSLVAKDRRQLAVEAGFDPDVPMALLVYHPVLQEADEASVGAQVLLDALLERGLQILVLMPNADAGSEDIRAVYARRSDHPKLRVETHLGRRAFASWMAAVDVMVGNSSAGIIEAASFGTRVVNVGSRQNLRQRSDNVIDVALERDAIAGALDDSLRIGRVPVRNVYGDGQAGGRIVSLLRSVSIDRGVLNKTNAY